MSYVPLHVHTDASSDGLGTVESLVSRAEYLGIDRMAMTDHGTLANVISFAQACKAHNVVPIVGLEAYLGYNGKRHHLTLLSDSPTGFESLVRISTEGHFRYTGGYPLVTLDDVEAFSSGVHILTGCASSPIHAGSIDDARKFVADLVSAAGRKSVHAEVMFVGSQNTWERPLALAKEFRLDYVVTNDTHFPLQSQFEAHQVLVQARKGFTYDSRELWLKTAGEIIERGSSLVGFEAVAVGLENTRRLVVDWEPPQLEASPALPSVPMAREELLGRARAAFEADTAALGSDERASRLARFKYEWGVLTGRGFVDYLYILSDIIGTARSRGIKVGPGRGSGCGSYVLYLLGITGIHPLEHGLVFERFFNPAREDYPDVDVDFESDRRGEVIDYAHERWGAVPIATYSTYNHKSLVHDIARVLKIPKEVEEPAADMGPESKEYGKLISYNPKVPAVYEALDGQIRHRGKHAGGVIITDKPIPLERVGDAMIAAWTEGDDKQLSVAGIVKFDLLGLTALSQIKAMEEMTGFKSEDVPLDDKAAMRVFRKGDVNGVFQWSGSEGIRDLTIRVAPSNFTDLVALNALYRPGGLDAGTALQYPDFKKSPRTIHPRLDHHLAETYGVICFQEQVMAIFAEVTGGSFADADLARRLIVKSKPDDLSWVAKVDKTRADFLSKGEASGLPKKTVEQVWEELMTHSRYSFNRSHSAAYSMIAFRMAYYKAHHPEAFYVAMLRYDRTNAQTYLFEAVERGIDVVMPDINSSGVEHVLVPKGDGWAIALPLTDIVQWGEGSVRVLLEERAKNGPFTSYEEFERRVPKKACNAKVRKNLERVGAFRGLAGDPRAAIKEYDKLPLTEASRTQQETLGYAVPTAELARTVQRMAEDGWIAGFIVDEKVKTSKRGAYTVYYLSPRGSFWSRDFAGDLVPGDFVAVRKNNWGMAVKVKKKRAG